MRPWTQTLLCGAGLLIAGPALALAHPAHFDIPPQSMPQALQAFAAQAHMQLLYEYNAIRNSRGNAVKGDLDSHTALEQLLRNSGLEAVYTSDSAATIRLVHSELTGNRGASGYDPTDAPEAVRLAPVGQDSATPADAPAAQADTIQQTPQLQEVIVTAEKRAERLQDVPVPVSVINTEGLVNSDQTLLRDYYSSVPGLSMTTTVQSSQIISIRGIVSNPGNPTVAVTVDDVPFGSSTIGGGGLVVPDFDPGDLSQVEVLRGPQGTLYGASSLAGLIKFVIADPSTSGVTGNLQAGIAGVHNGDALGYSYRGAINLPMSDTLAVRASGFGRLDPGYIENPLVGVKGINTARAAGGLFSGLWRPTSEFSVKLTALLQQVKGDGSSDADIAPGLGDLQQNYIPGIGRYERHVQFYMATIRARFAGIDLVSISGYNINQFSDSWDFTFGLGQLTQAQFGVSGSPISNFNRTKKFTQELRLSGSVGSRFDWRVGGFYTHEDSTYIQYLLAENPVSGAIVGNWCSCYSPEVYAEIAGFADLTYHVSKRFDVQVGARQSEIRQIFEPVVSIGPYTEVFLGLPSPAVVPVAYASDNPFTYLFTPRFQVSPDLMLYARLASGYQTGGANQGVPGVPPEYAPSKTLNYELGAKGDFLNQRLSLDASVFYIDWKNIQLSFLDPKTFLAYNGNGSRAKSEGVELSARWAPIENLNLSGWISYDNAVLKEPFPPDVVAAGEYGVAGDRLPFSSRFSGYLAAEKEFPISGEWTGILGGDVNYAGDRLGFFTGTPDRTRFGGYAKLDLHLGVKVGSWTANAFANNVADRRAPIAGGQGYFPPNAFQYIAPRTIGLSVSKAFP